jgi:hypothetical protein
LHDFIDSLKLYKIPLILRVEKCVAFLPGHSKPGVLQRRAVLPCIFRQQEIMRILPTPIFFNLNILYPAYSPVVNTVPAGSPACTENPTVQGRKRPKLTVVIGFISMLLLY